MDNEALIERANREVLYTGQPCKVTARGTMNSILVVFADGYSMVTSGNAIRKAKP